MAKPARSLMQFSLRGMMAITTGVAVLAAILIPWIRTFEPARQRRVGEFIVIFALGLAFGLALACYLRFRVERCANSPCVRLSCYFGSSYTRKNAVFCYLLMLVPPLLFVSTGPLDNLQFNVMFRIISFLYGALLAGAVTWIWWRRSRFDAELCKEGVAFTLWFRPWSKPKRFKWNEDHDILSLQTSWTTFQFEVEPEQQAEVDQIVRRCLRETQLRVN